jgi:hypothetical protein
LNDGKLLAILSAGDVIAQELEYHIFHVSEPFITEREITYMLQRQPKRG